MEQSAGSSLYSSVALSVKGSSIRLVTLVPGTPSSPIRCQLNVVDLDDRPSYEALSYAWGASNEQRTVEVNGASHIHVTDDLFHALRALRRRIGRKRTLWVDALCINQADYAEKSKQVPLMSKIYSAAQCVDIWFGDPGTSWPFNLAPLLRPLSLLKLAMFPSDRINNVKLEPLRLVWSVLRNDGGRVSKALQSTSSAWHERGWVVQEYVCARKAYLCLGRRRTPFRTNWLVSILSFNDVLGSSPFNDIYKFLLPSMQRLTTAKAEWIHNRSVNRAEDGAVCGLEQFARLTAMTKTGDPRDKIYSLLALLPELEAEMMEPDYSAPVWKAFAVATWASLSATMKRRGDLTILALVNLTDRTTKGLPSWAVDFTNIPTSHMGYISGNYADYWQVIRGEILDPRGKTVMLDRENGYLALQAAFGDVVISVVAMDDTNITQEPLSDDITTLLATALIAVRGRHGVADKVSERSTAPLFHDLIHTYAAMSPTLNQPNPRDQDSEALDGPSRLPQVVPPFTVWDQGLIMEHRPEKDRSERELNWEHSVKENIMVFDKYAQSAAGGISLFATSSGFVGFGPRTVQEGDVVAVIESHCPFVLLRPYPAPLARMTGLQRVHKFCGLAYVHGLMDKRFWDQWPGKISLDTVLLA